MRVTGGSPPVPTTQERGDDTHTYSPSVFDVQAERQLRLWVPKGPSSEKLGKTEANNEGSTKPGIFQTLSIPVGGALTPASAPPATLKHPTGLEGGGAEAGGPGFLQGHSFWAKENEAPRTPMLGSFPHLSSPLPPPKGRGRAMEGMLPSSSLLPGKP